MIPVFPSRPLLNWDSFALTPVPNLRRTEFENGAVRQAPGARYARVERKVKFTVCDAACYAEIRKFINETLAQGSRWFLWDCPDAAVYGLGPRIRCRIVGGGVEFSPRDADLEFWDVAMTIETWAAE